MRKGDMTSGNIWKLIATFAVPLLLGNFLQQLYNAFDAIVVGNFVSNEALAAVGSTGPLINMIIAFFMGMSTGASVLIAQASGAQDRERIQKTVHTAILLSVIMGVVLSLIGIFLSPALLELMKTPPEIMDDAVLYLRIIFSGLTALTVYNMGAAVLMATGDSRTPLYFLILSTIINAVGNLLFVLVFHMGVDGVALSTVISQIVSAVLVILVLCRSHTDFQLNIKKLRIDGAIVKSIVKIGLPAAVQQAIISLSNIVVQGYINGLGGIAVAGYSASTKLDAFIMLPTQTMGLVATTFVGQNLGAHQVKRARQGVRNIISVNLLVTILLSVGALIFGQSLLRIFTTDQEVLTAGFEFMKTFVPFYFVLCFTQTLPGALRGAGDVRVGTLICIISFVGLRQIYLFFVTQFHYTIFSVGFSYPITWSLAAIALLIYYKKSNWDSFEKPEELTA